VAHDGRLESNDGLPGRQGLGHLGQDGQHASTVAAWMSPCGPRAPRLPCVPTDDPFAAVLRANEGYADSYRLAGLEARAARGLAVVTCMDSRIDPLAMLGLSPGDAKIVRNAGARVTDDVLRTLVLASYLLGVDTVMVVPHTECRMTTPSEAHVHAAIRDAGGPDTRSIAFLTSEDQESDLRADVQRVRSWPYLGNVSVGGFLYDLGSGRVRQVC